jgi:hypothetical protein
MIINIIIMGGRKFRKLYKVVLRRKYHRVKRIVLQNLCE